MATALRPVLYIATITIVLATSAVAQEPERRYWIAIAEPLKFVFQDRTELNMPCRTHKKVYGCTFFAEERLSCSCQRSGKGWRLLAKARFVPVIYLYVRRPDVVDHEQLHIDDVRARLTEYLEKLTAREFPTEERCSKEAKAASQEIVFVRRVNDFRGESNEKLDPW